MTRRLTAFHLKNTAYRPPLSILIPPVGSGWRLATQLRIQDFAEGGANLLFDIFFLKTA